MSIRRYLPPIGTAGFERWWVRGKRRVPRPPPSTMVRTSSMRVSQCICKSYGPQVECYAEFTDPFGGFGDDGRVRPGVTQDSRPAFGPRTAESAAQGGGQLSMFSS